MKSLYLQLFNEKKRLSLFQKVIFLIIIFSFVVIIIESEPSIKSIKPNFFFNINLILSYIFLFEYLLRLITCGYSKKYKGIFGKIKFILSFHSIVDLVSFVPSLIFPGLNETFLFRILRVLRVLKLAKFTDRIPALKNITMVIDKRKNEILFSLAITVVIILFTSIIIYLAEGNAQPDAFGSIPRAFWWSTITLTTIGYGDVYPITIIGKICTVIISISGIGIVAIPTGIIAAGFSELVNKKK